MTDATGPTFTSELAVAGCPLDGLSWDPATGGIIQTESDAQRAAFARVLAAHDPTKRLPADVPGYAIVGALSRAQAGQCDVRDLARIAWRDDVPATNNKLKRIADAIGSTPDALRQAAVTSI